MISRRKILGAFALLASASVLWPFVARGQHPADRPARIGLLRSSPTPDRLLEALRRGLAAKGYVEARQYVFVRSFGNGDPRRLPELAAALVSAGIDIIVTEGNLTAVAARDATETIPIVMATSADPLRAGLIESLSRPGRNVTGNAGQATEMTGKLLQLAKEMVPGLSRVAQIAPSTGIYLFRAESIAAARALGIEIVQIDLIVPDVDAALQRAAHEQAQAVVIRGRPFFSSVLAKLTVELAAARRLPAVYESRDFVELGGLLSFGVDVPDLYHRAANFIDKILQGAKPADLPVEQPNKFELVVNLKTAKALGISIPQSILLRADEVIE